MTAKQWGMIALFSLGMNAGLIAYILSGGK